MLKQLGNRKYFYIIRGKLKLRLRKMYRSKWRGGLQKVSRFCGGYQVRG